MKIPKTADILGIINKIAPPALAETWDNSGLQMGDPAADITRIMVALDPTPDVIDSAIASSCQMLVTHHPLIFKPISSISTSTTVGSTIHKAIKAGLSILSMHTNYDIARGGLNDLLAGRIGVTDTSPLKITSSSALVKLVVFVPVQHMEKLRSALLTYTFLQGDYRDCSFSVDGTGTFTPLHGANPYIGKVDTMSEVVESRLELLLERTRLPLALKIMLATHPYEAPAFDVYPLLNEGEKVGIGRIGHLQESISLVEYTAKIRKILGTRTLRYVGDPAARISKVALCSGSGASLLHEAARSGADLLVTGDVKYHEARDAQAIGIALIDAGHFPSEIIMVDEITRRVGEALLTAGYTDCHIEACRTETDPFLI